MRRGILATISILTAITMTAGTLYAANVQFKAKPPVTFTDNGLTLTACGALTGLGNEDVNITVTATGVPTITCTSPGGNDSPGQNPGEIQVSGTQSFPASQVKNGTLMFCVPTQQPPHLSGKEGGCPNNNWTATITDIAFSGFTITVEQGGVVVLQRSY